MTLPGRFQLGWGLALALASCLLSPALTSVHVEGFSAQIQSLALVLAQQGSIAGHDLARPVISQYLFLTRPGVVDILALADWLFGNTGDTGFRVLMVASLAVLLGASAMAARQMGGARLRLGLLACVLTPGLAELGFYFNDNLVSAAFSALAVGAVWQTGGRRAAAAAAWAAATGVLAVCAVLCRIDAVLVAPLLTLLFVLRQQQLKTAALGAGWMLAAAMLAWAAAAGINGATPLDVQPLLARFSNSTGYEGRLKGELPVLYFFGLLTPLLLLPGACRFWSSRPRGWRFGLWLAAFYLYPLAMLFHALRSSTEIRYYLPLLAPLVALYGAQGWDALQAAFRRGVPWQRRTALGAATIAGLLVVLPPMLSIMKDGPRVLVGRLWSPLLWQRWQASVETSMEQVQRVVDDMAASPVATVMTLHWNDEFHLRLRLFEAGFREVPADADCRPLSQYRKGAQVVWHIRLLPQYSLQPFEPGLAGALMLSAVGRCAGLRQSGVAWATTFDKPMEYAQSNGVYAADFPGPFDQIVARTLDERWRHRQEPALAYGLVTAAPLALSHLNDLGLLAAERVARQALRSGQSPAAMLDRYEQAFSGPPVNE